MKKDPDLVLKWSAKTSELAQKVVASPQPTDADEVENWKARVDYARQVNTYTEYSLYAMALQTADPKKQVELIEALQQRNPKSEYLAKAVEHSLSPIRRPAPPTRQWRLPSRSRTPGISRAKICSWCSRDDAVKKKEADKVHTYTAKTGGGDERQAQARRRSLTPTGRKRKNTILGLAYYHERETVFQRRQAGAGRPGIAQVAAAGGRERRREDGSAVLPGSREL